MERLDTVQLERLTCSLVLEMSFWIHSRVKVPFWLGDAVVSSSLRGEVLKNSQASFAGILASCIEYSPQFVLVGRLNIRAGEPQGM